MDKNPANGKPSATDLDHYDHLLARVLRLQELTRCEGWSEVADTLAALSADATRKLESAEKMNDVIRCQVAIALVREQKAPLRQAVDDLNEHCERYPLFAQDFPCRADFNELDSRVTLIGLGTLSDLPIPPDLRAGEEIEAPSGRTDGTSRHRRRVHAPSPASPSLPEESHPEPGDPFDD
ncbi:MAG: hypothetical protein WC326_15160 [Candidatus Delongbacteria bacterium]